MEHAFTPDMDTINEVLQDRAHTKELQEVFAFVEMITGRKYNPDRLTAEDINIWNKRLDEVLTRLFAHAT